MGWGCKDPPYYLIREVVLLCIVGVNLPKMGVFFLSMISVQKCCDVNVPMHHLTRAESSCLKLTVKRDGFQIVELSGCDVDFEIFYSRAASNSWFTIAVADLRWRAWRCRNFLNFLNFILLIFFFFWVGKYYPSGMANSAPFLWWWEENLQPFYNSLPISQSHHALGFISHNAFCL